MLKGRRDVQSRDTRQEGDETCEEETDTVVALKAALSRETALKAAERAGRIRAERQLRDMKLLLLAREEIVTDSDEQGRKRVDVGVNRKGPRPESCGAVVVPFPVLGTFRSSFSRRNGTPRQSQLVPLARGQVILHSHVPNAALEGLHEFGHIWLIYSFHANTNVLGGRLSESMEQVRSTPRAKVRVPRLDGERRGVLATRSPHRPAPIGLSLVAVRRVDVKRGLLDVGGADLVDGTPIIDLKPYVPFCDEPRNGKVFAPRWVVLDGGGIEGEPLHITGVKWSSGAKEVLREVWTSRACTGKSLYDTAEDLETFVEQVLSRDIRSTHLRLNSKFIASNLHKKDNEEVNVGRWEVVLDGILIRYDVSLGGEVTVSKRIEKNPA